MLRNGYTECRISAVCNRQALEDRIQLQLDVIEHEAVKSEQVVLMNEREVLQYQDQSRQIGMVYELPIMYSRKFAYYMFLKLESLFKWVHAPMLLHFIWKHAHSMNE